MKKDDNFVAVFKKYFRKDEMLLLPNILCYFRILLIIVFLIFYLTPFSCLGNDRAGIYFATATMVLAAYTDFLDGFIARTYNMISDLGKALDPISDKFLQLAIVSALCVKLYMFPSIWLMFSIFICKEGTLFFQNVFLARRNRSFGAAKWFGKVSTFVFYLVLGSLLLGTPFILSSYPLDTQNGFLYAHIIIDSLCALACFFLVLAWIGYSIYLLVVVTKGKNEVPEESLENKKEEI